MLMIAVWLLFQLEQEAHVLSGATKQMQDHLSSEKKLLSRVNGGSSTIQLYGN